MITLVSFYTTIRAVRIQIRKVPLEQWMRCSISTEQQGSRTNWSISGNGTTGFTSNSSDIPGMQLS